MSQQVFVVRLKASLQKTGLTAYMISKETGVAVNTVVRYLENETVVSKHLAPTVIRLADFCKLNWRDPSVVEVTEIGDDTPEIKSLLDARGVA